MHMVFFKVKTGFKGSFAKFAPICDEVWKSYDQAEKDLWKEKAAKIRWSQLGLEYKVAEKNLKHHSDDIWKFFEYLETRQDILEIIADTC